MKTAKEIKEQVLAKGIEWIPCHDCCICGETVGYLIIDGNPFFHPGCGCRWAPA